MADYLEYPPSKFSGGLAGRRPDWDNPHAGQVLGEDVVKALQGCGHSWESFVNLDTGERKVRLTDYCHERLFCGICATSESNERASTWLEHFGAVNGAYDVDVAGFEATFTMPSELSALIADRADKRSILNALFEGVHSVMRGVGLLAWVVVLHAVSSERPGVPHVHFITFYPGLDDLGRAIPGYVDREQFADRRRRFLGAWNRELEAVCKRFGLGDWRCENVHLSYSKGLDDLAGRVRYEMRPPLQDAFIHARGSAAELEAAVTMATSFLFPPGGKVAMRRIRGGGKFGARVITSFLEGLGYSKVAKDAGEWVSEGPARLVGEHEQSVTFALVRSGEFVTVPRASVSMAAHGCSFKWGRAGP